MCIDNSEWTRNGDYAPTRFQVRARGWRRRGATCACTRVGRASVSVPPSWGRARLLLPSARLFFFPLPATLTCPSSLPPHTLGPGRRGQPAGRRQDAGQSRKRGGRADDGGQGAPGAGHADARPRPRVERDAGVREKEREGCGRGGLAPRRRPRRCGRVTVLGWGVARVARRAGTPASPQAGWRGTAGRSTPRALSPLDPPPPLFFFLSRSSRTSPSRAPPTCPPPSRSPSSPSSTGPTSTSASGSSCLWGRPSRRMRPPSSKSARS